jgi:ribosome recycling factor
VRWRRPLRARVRCSEVPDAHAGMLDHLQILAYGKMMPLTALGQPVLKNSNLLVINVFDQSVSAVLMLMLLLLLL